MIDDYAANYVWLHKPARDAYAASEPQALETWVDQYHDTAGDLSGLRVPMVPRITDEDLDEIQQRHLPEPGYDAALSIVQQYQHSRADVLIDRHTHIAYVPLPSGFGVVKQSALVDAVRARLAPKPAPVAVAPKPAPKPEEKPLPHWYSRSPRVELLARGYKLVGRPPAAHATYLDYMPTANAWLAEHGADIRRVYRNVPEDKFLSITLANTILGLERTN